METALDHNAGPWYVLKDEALFGEIVEIMFINRVVDKTNGVDMNAPWLAPCLTWRGPQFGKPLTAVNIC